MHNSKQNQYKTCELYFALCMGVGKFIKFTLYSYKKLPKFRALTQPHAQRCLIYNAKIMLKNKQVIPTRLKLICNSYASAGQ